MKKNLYFSSTWAFGHLVLNSDFNICVAAPQSFVRTFTLCPQLNEASYMERSFEQSYFFILSVLLYTLEVTILYSMFYFIDIVVSDFGHGFRFFSYVCFARGGYFYDIEKINI